MLTFNDLLTIEGIDPTQVRLVRHQDRRLPAGRLYEAWRNDRVAFEAYQSAQVRDVFPSTPSWPASSSPTPARRCS